jgi:ribose/xylose/arabinose/galactoside ABC-type transport system permease subunit
VSADVETALVPEAARSRGGRTSSGRLSLIRGALLPILLVGEVVAFALASPQFFTGGNLLNIAINAADVALIAGGLTLVILLGGIDVSTGFAMGAIAWVVAHMMGSAVSPGLIILSAVAIGIVAGLVNGVLVTRLAIPSIVATLGTSAIYQTVLFALWNRTDVFSGPVATWLSRQGSLLGIPTLVLLVLVIYAVLHFVLTSTVFGRSVYAIGSNREAATLAGVRTDRVRITCFAIVGALVGVAACTYVGRVGVVQASTGSDIALLAIAAVVVGGTSILGGEGSVIRTLGGVIFIAVLQNGVVLAGVPPLWNGLMVGLVILLAVSIDGVVSNLDSRRARRAS